MRVSSLSKARLSRLDHARRLRRSIVALAVPLAVMAFVPTAFAQAPEASSQDIAQARQLGQQAQAAYDGGNYAESEKLWNAAAKLYPQAPTLTLGLARTQAKLGHVVGAQESYNKIIREWSNNPSPPPAFKDALEAAKAEVGAVSTKVANVVISVEGPAKPQVTIDGETVPPAALGLKRPVDPGQHIVKATADGYNPAETTFHVPEGGAAEAKLKMDKVSGTPEGGPGPGPAPGGEPGADTGSKGSKVPAYIAFGVGGAGLVVGAITGIIAIGKHGDLKDKCGDSGSCPSSAQSDVDSYKSVGTISTVGFIVAGVGVAAGVVLLLTAPSGGSASSTASSKYTTVEPSSAANRDKGRASGVTVGAYFGGTSAGLTGSF
jgi:hypothetical protein